MVRKDEPLALITVVEMGSSKAFSCSCEGELAGWLGVEHNTRRNEVPNRIVIKADRRTEGHTNNPGEPGTHIAPSYFPFAAERTRTGYDRLRVS